jgi:hypothetical protein
VSTPAAPSYWNTEEAARLAREAYRYVSRTYPLDADLEPLGVADRAVLEAQERGDWPGYLEALREMCRVAKREAIKATREKGAA